MYIYSLLSRVLWLILLLNLCILKMVYGNRPRGGALSPYGFTVIRSAAVVSGNISGCRRRSTTIFHFLVLLHDNYIFIVVVVDDVGLFVASVCEIHTF